jgi:hypothetical protein
MSKAGYTPVSDDDGADESSSIYNDKSQGGKVVEGMSKSQRRWRYILVVFCVADLVCNGALYQMNHEFAGTWSFPNDGIGWSDDTLDLFALSVVRVICTAILVPLTLRIGIDALPNGKLPHEQTDAQLARGARTDKIRPVMLALMFLIGATSSVYAGIKVIMFEFESLPVPETAMAPFLLISIAVVNLEFTSIKRLISSYVMRVGLIETPLHLHPLKYYPKGPPNKRRWGNNKKCDICRENQTKKPTYTCSDCNLNICVTCFETKAGDADGAATENVVRSEKGRAKQLELTTWSYFQRLMAIAKGEWIFVVLALSCLLVSSIAGLMQPNYQGALFDSIVVLDPVEFKDIMYFYVGFQVRKTHLFCAILD